MTEPGAMDLAPLSAREIQAWAEMMGEPLTPWEFRALRAMSRAYVSGAKSDTAPYEPLALKLALASASIMAH